MTIVSDDQGKLLSMWQQHTYAEFVLKDADAAVATMTEDPYVFIVPAGIALAGKDVVREFYANHFLSRLPPDIELVPVSQTFGKDCIVEEMVIRFTHSVDMDWMIPGVLATGRKVEFVLVAVIRFENGKVASEHLHWDQATVLSQLGIVTSRVAANGLGSAAKLLALTAATAMQEKFESRGGL